MFDILRIIDIERPISLRTHNALDNIRKISKSSLGLDIFLRPITFNQNFLYCICFPGNPLWPKAASYTHSESCKKSLEVFPCPSRENYSRLGRVWFVTSRLGTEKPLNLLTVYAGVISLRNPPMRRTFWRVLAASNEGVDTL
jgi:hypothetical protein